MDLSRILFITICLLFIFSCKQNNLEIKKEKWKQEILETEQNFEKLLKEEGIHNAFVAYAAKDAVLMRDNALIVSKDTIDAYYKNSNTKNLSWAPDYIDVSSSGDLAYTYGKYNYTYKDSLGNTLVDTGVFHTVWKRQDDGSWKFVWD